MKKISLFALLAAVSTLAGCSGSGTTNVSQQRSSMSSDTRDSVTAESDTSAFESEVYDDIYVEVTSESISSDTSSQPEKITEEITQTTEPEVPVSSFNEQKNTDIGKLQPAEWIGKPVEAFEYAYDVKLSKGDYFTGSTKLNYPEGFDTGFTLLVYPTNDDDVSDNTITGVIAYSSVRPGLEIYNGIRSATSWNAILSVLPEDAEIYEPSIDDVEGTGIYSALAYFGDYKLIVSWGTEYIDMNSPCMMIVMCQR